MNDMADSVVYTQKEEPCSCDPTGLSEMESGCSDSWVAGLNQVHMEYLNSNVDKELHQFRRFKQMAADLVNQKEEEQARSMIVLGDEESVNEEDSIECVTGSLLEEIDPEMYNLTRVERNAIHAITVSELLLKLEV